MPIILSLNVISGFVMIILNSNNVKDLLILIALIAIFPLVGNEMIYWVMYPFVLLLLILVGFRKVCLTKEGGVVECVTYYGFGLVKKKHFITKSNSVVTYFCRRYKGVRETEDYLLVKGDLGSKRIQNLRMSNDKVEELGINVSNYLGSIFEDVRIVNMKGEKKWWRYLLRFFYSVIFRYKL